MADGSSSRYCLLMILLIWIQLVFKLLEHFSSIKKTTQWTVQDHKNTVLIRFSARFHTLFWVGGWEGRSCSDLLIQYFDHFVLFWYCCNRLLLSIMIFAQRLHHHRSSSQLTDLVCLSVSTDCNTYDSSLHHCCLSSRHRRRTSRWSVYTFCCCTETVRPRTHPLLENKTRGGGEQRPDGSAANGYSGIVSACSSTVICKWMPNWYSAFIRLNWLRRWERHGLRFLSLINLLQATWLKKSAVGKAAQEAPRLRDIILHNMQTKIQLLQLADCLRCSTDAHSRDTHDRRAEAPARWAPQAPHSTPRTSHRSQHTGGKYFCSFPLFFY